MKKTKIIALILSIVTIFSVCSVSFANDYDLANTPMLISENPMEDDSIKVQLNGENIDFTDENGIKVEPQIMNGRTMVPMRKIFEVFGANVDWAAETRTITATTEEKTLVLQIENEIATLSEGEVTEEIKLDSVPVIYNGRTMVPVRFIAESLELNVGWEAETRTVVIIDSNFIFEKIKVKAPTFYEYLTASYENPKTMESDLDMTLTVDYTNSEDKSANTNLKITLDGLAKKSENLIGTDFDIKTSGKGELLDVLKENGFEKITMNMLINPELMKLYIKSSLLEAEIGNKWAELDFSSEIENVSELMNQENMSVKEAIDNIFNSIELTSSTYYDIDSIVDILCLVASDEFFTVTGRTAKVYTYEISVEDLLEIVGAGLTKEEMKEITDILNVEIKATTKIENNVATEGTFSINGKIKMESESIEIGLEAVETVSKINEEIKIEMPKDDEIEKIDMEEQNETVKRAQFVSFVNEVAEVQQLFDTMSVTVKGNEAKNGIVRTDAQIFNFVAKGGDVNTEGYESLMLPRSEAESIPFTKIDTEKVKNIDIIIPETEVLTEEGEMIETSYYVTREGTVFVWPPFVYENELYPTYNPVEIIDGKINIDGIEINVDDLN